MDHFEQISAESPVGQENENKIFFAESTDDSYHAESQDANGANPKPLKPPAQLTLDAITDDEQHELMVANGVHAKQKHGYHDSHDDSDSHSHSHSHSGNEMQDPLELNEMRSHLFTMMHQEATSRGISYQNVMHDLMVQQTPKAQAVPAAFGDPSSPPNLDHSQSITSPMSTQSSQKQVMNAPPAHSVQHSQHLMQSVQSQQAVPAAAASYNAHGHSGATPQYEHQGTVHPAVQQLYEQQQQLLQKLELLANDDPDPQSAKLWNIMQRIFTEENAEQRQQNIADLTDTLEQKHKEVQTVNENVDTGLSVTDQRLLRSIHEMSKETKNELKEMRQRLDEEREKNKRLRSKIRDKNRQLKHYANRNNVDDDAKEEVYRYTIPGVYDSNAFTGRNNEKAMDSDDVDSVSTFADDKPSTFQSWCINMGFQPTKTRCEWF